MAASFFAAAARRFSRQQVHVQSQHVAGLRVATMALGIGIIDYAEGRRSVVGAGDEAILFDKLLLKCGANILEKLRELSSSSLRPVAWAMRCMRVTS